MFDAGCGDAGLRVGAERVVDDARDQGGEARRPAGRIGREGVAPVGLPAIAVVPSRTSDGSRSPPG